MLGAQTAQRGRSDGLWSKRFGVLYPPNDNSPFHTSYGTSFNTSGDTDQCDDQTRNTAPEGSENFEVGAMVDALAGRLSTRAALFNSIKNNERNRDPDSAASAALLSGKRHTTGIEFDIAGPNRNPAGLVAPSVVTADLLAEYTVSETVAVKFNLLNLTNKLYADALYTGHYVPGAPRKLLMTVTSRF